MTIVARATAALPPGTLLVGGGFVVLGAASYVHLAVAGHALDSDGMAGVSVLWTIVFSLGLGLFQPVEQEITRVVAGRAVRGEGVRPVLVRGTLLACGMLAAVLAGTFAAAGPIADRLFDGDRQLVAALGGAFAGLVAVSVTRGVLAGLGRFKAYGTSLALDGGLRMVLALALGIGGSDSPLMFSLILTVAPLFAAVATLGSVLRSAHAGPAAPWRSLSDGLGLLVAATLLAQMVVNMAVIDVKLLQPEKTALVSALLAALVLARVPLFVFGALQASLLSGLATASARGDQAGFRQLLIRGLAIVSSLGLLGGLGAVLLGPWLIRTLFDAPPGVLGHVDFVWLAAGTVAYMLAMVLGQALMTTGRHRVQLLAWVVGTAVLAAVTLLPGDVRMRVELAYAAGAFTVAVMMALALRKAVPSGGTADRDALGTPQPTDPAGVAGGRP